MPIDRDNLLDSAYRRLQAIRELADALTEMPDESNYNQRSKAREQLIAHHQALIDIFGWLERNTDSEHTH